MASDAARTFLAFGPPAAITGTGELSITGRNEADLCGIAHLDDIDTALNPNTRRPHDTFRINGYRMRGCQLSAQKAKERLSNPVHCYCFLFSRRFYL
jgi:hypothetical protein